MDKKRLFTLVPIVLILMIITVNNVAAANQFQDLTNLINDMFGFIGSVFDLPMFHDANLAFGFILFLLWIIVFSALYLGASVAFRGTVPKPVTAICLAFATLTIVLINVQRFLFVMIIGNWIFFASIAIILFFIWLAHKIPNGIFRGAVLFILLLFTLLVSNLLPRSLALLIASFNVAGTYPVVLMVPLMREVIKRYKKEEGR